MTLIIIKIATKSHLKCTTLSPLASRKRECLLLNSRAILSKTSSRIRWHSSIILCLQSCKFVGSQRKHVFSDKFYGFWSGDRASHSMSHRRPNPSIWKIRSQNIPNISVIVGKPSCWNQKCYGYWSFCCSADMVRLFIETQYLPPVKFPPMQKFVYRKILQ